MSDAVAHKAKYFVGVLLFCGTLFGGYQAWRKGETERQERAEAAEQKAELAELRAVTRENAFLRAFNADTFARVSVDERGIVDGITEGAVKLTGLSREQVVGKPFSELHLFDDGQAAELEAPPAGKVLRPELPFLMNRVGKKPVEVLASSEGIETPEGRAAIISLNRAKAVVELPAASE